MGAPGVGELGDVDGDHGRGVVDRFSLDLDGPPRWCVGKVGDKDPLLREELGRQGFCGVGAAGHLFWKEGPQPADGGEVERG